MVIQQVGSRGRVAAELFERRRGSRCEDKKQVRPDQMYAAFLPSGLPLPLQTDRKALKVRGGLQPDSPWSPTWWDTAHMFQGFFPKAITD